MIVNNTEHDDDDDDREASQRPHPIPWHRKAATTVTKRTGSN